MNDSETVALIGEQEQNQKCSYFHLNIKVVDTHLGRPMVLVKQVEYDSAIRTHQICQNDSTEKRKNGWTNNFFSLSKRRQLESLRQKIRQHPGREGLFLFACLFVA